MTGSSKVEEIRITSYNVCYTKLLRGAEIFASSNDEQARNHQRIAAFILVWMTGRLSNLHQQGNWRAHRNRRNGLLLTAVLALLALSGIGLYYP